MEIAEQFGGRVNPYMGVVVVNNPAAFRACFTDWKLIRGRKCVQIILEVPLEGADEAYRVLGGMPDPGKSVWCGIARLRDAGDAAGAGRETEPPTVSRSRPTGRWVATQWSNQAGILCADRSFHTYLIDTYPDRWRLLNEGTDEERAALIVRSLCGVTSRKDIMPDTPAGDRWRGIVSAYRAWKIEPAVVA